MVGERISHHNLLEKLGQGGMGEVYLAQDTRLKRNVALKFLNREFTRDEESIKRFEREAQATASLNHPNIVTIYEIGEHDGQTYIAMEFVDGVTLGKKMSDTGIEKTAELPQILDLVTQICDGLQAAHEAGIVHRDIKPGNIMIDQTGRVRILDFGLAKLSAMSRITSEISTVGTVQYMSPEQVSGDPVDHRSDIWSLGVLFYEMVTGQLPFRGEKKDVVMYSILNKEPASVSDTKAYVPSELESIINKSLAKDIADRYQDIKELIADLKNFYAVSGYEFPLKGIRPGVRSKPLSRYLMAGLLLVTLIVVASYFLVKKEPVSELPGEGSFAKPSIAILYFENDSGDETLETWRYGLAKLLITDLSQSKYMDVLQVDQLNSILKELKLDKTRNYTTEDLAKIGKRAEVKMILTSSFMKMGEKWAITARLKNLETGRIEHAIKLTAKNEDDLAPTVDTLTVQLKSKLNFTETQLANDIDRSLKEVITGSPEALKFYIEGERFHHNNRSREAIECFKKAIQLDPDFAMAHLMLSRCYSNTGQYKKSMNALEKAISLNEHMPLRERYLVEADYHRVNGRYKRAIELLQQLLKNYPDNSNARHIMAHNYASLGKYKAAIEQCNQISKKTELIYRNLVHWYCLNGEYDKAREKWGEFFEKDKYYPLYAMYMWGIYLSEGRLNEAKHYIKTGKAQIVDGHSFNKTLEWAFNERAEVEFALYEDNHQKVVHLANQLDKRDPFAEHHLHSFTYYIVATSQMASGKIDKAIFYMNKSFDLTGGSHALQELETLKVIGALLIRNNRFAEARDIFTKADSLLEKNLAQGPPNLYRFWKRTLLFWKSLLEWNSGNLKKAEILKKERHLMIPEDLKRTDGKNLLLEGHAALNKKRIKKAIRYFRDATDLLPGEYVESWPRIDAVYLYTLAKAYEMDGDSNNAIVFYRKLSKLLLGRLNFGDLYAKSYLHLGKLYQKTGDKEKAIKNYKKFIELWKDCDPPLRPMVDDARKELNKLIK